MPPGRVGIINVIIFERLAHAFLVRERGRTDGFTEHQAGGLVVVWFVRCVHASLDAECGLYSATAQAGPLQGHSRDHAGFVSFRWTSVERKKFRSKAGGQSASPLEHDQYCIWVRL